MKKLIILSLFALASLPTTLLAEPQPKNPNDIIVTTTLETVR